MPLKLRCPRCGNTDLFLVTVPQWFHCVVDSEGKIQLRLGDDAAEETTPDGGPV